MVISSNGTIAALDLTGSVLVLNRLTMKGFSYSFGASVAMLCMDGDANFIGYGFTPSTWVLAHTGGGIYKLLMTYRMPGEEVASSCVIGGEKSNYAFAVAYSAFTYSQNQIAKWSLNMTQAPVNPDWVWVGPKSTGGYQDLLPSAAITSDGEYFAFAGWGNSQKTSPQVVVFRSGAMEPLVSYVTPGSMFDVGIFGAGPGGIYVVAAGKHVHANQMGDGGDLYFFNIPA